LPQGFGQGAVAAAAEIDFVFLHQIAGAGKGGDDLADGFGTGKFPFHESSSFCRAIASTHG